MTTMTAEEPTAEELPVRTRQEALEQRVLLIHTTVGWWKGVITLPDRDTKVTSGGRDVDKDSVTAPRATLMTEKYPLDANGKSWRARFQKIESRVAAIRNKYSLAFPIQGVRIVPKSQAAQLLDELYGPTLSSLYKQRDTADDPAIREQLQRRIDDVLAEEGSHASPNTPVFNPDATEQSVAYELRMAAYEFCNDWTNIREQMARNNKVWDKVESRVPRNAQLLRNKFHLDVLPVELSSGNSQELTAGDLQTHAAMIRETCQRRTEEAIEELIQEPRNQLARTLENLYELVNRDGRVTQKSFKPVRDAIAKIRMFDFVANPALLAKITELENDLDARIPTELNSATAATTGFNAAIESYMTEVQNAQQMQRDLEEFGRHSRNLLL